MRPGSASKEDFFQGATVVYSDVTDPTSIESSEAFSKKTGEEGALHIRRRR